MQQDAFTVLCDASIVAFAELAAADGIHCKQFNLPLVASVLKEVVSSNLDSILSEWDRAAQANVGDAWLRALISTQVIDLARAAYAQYREQTL